MAKINLEIFLKAGKAIAGFQKMRAQTQKINAATKKLDAQTNLYNQRIKQQAARTALLNAKLKNTEKQIKNTGNAFDVFKGIIGAQVFTQLARTFQGFISSSINVTGELETLTTQFEVLTGSAGLANKAVADLQQFAANTPFQFKDLARAQQRLLSFGFSLDEVQSRLIDIADVSAASGADIGELSLIFGQVRAAGKLTGERLLQFQERAIPIGPALAKTLGVAESSIKDLVSQGKVDFATFEKAFLSLNDTGQFAFEGTIKRSRTLEGRLSTLSDNFELLQANIGQKVAPAFKAILTTVTLFIQRLQQSADFNSFLDTIGNQIPNAISFAIDSFGFIINSVLNVIKVFNLFRSGLVTALSVVVNAFTKFIDIYTAVINALGLGDTALGRSINSVKAFKTDVISSLDETANGFAKSAAEISLSQEKVNASIDSSKKFILNAYNEELSAAEAQASAIDTVNKAKVQSEQTTTTQSIEELQKLSEARKSLALAQEEARLIELDRQAIFNEERLAKLQEYFTLEQEAAFQAKLNLAETETEKQILLTQIEEEALKNRLQLQKDAAADAAKIIEQDNNELAKIEKRKDDERLQNRQSTLRLFTTLAQSSSKELAAIGKAAALTQIAIDTEEAVSGAYAWGASLGGPALGALFGGIAAAAQASRAARVVGIQGFEQGGIVPGTSFTGDNVAARVNSGEMILNRQQQSQLFAMANGQGMGQSGPQEIVVNTKIQLNEETIAEAVSRQVANGLVLGEVQ